MKWKVFKNQFGLWQADNGTLFCAFRDWTDAIKFAYGWAKWTYDHPRMYQLPSNPIAINL